jgi:hypothetical protein
MCSEHLMGENPGIKEGVPKKAYRYRKRKMFGRQKQTVILLSTPLSGSMQATNWLT